MNTSTRLQKLEVARRQSEPLRLHLLFADELAPGEQPDIIMKWPEDEPKRTPAKVGSTA